MSKLLIRAAVLAGTILAGIGGYLASLPRADTQNYFASIADKEALLKTTPSPRIILVGGSNIAFGIDSRAISQEMHMPVVNIGLHADIGLRLMLAQVKPYLREGDIVVLIPEYEQFVTNEFDGKNAILSAVIEVFPQILRHFEPDQYLLLPDISRYLIRYAHDRLKNPLQFHSEVYQRSSINNHGDMVAHLNKAPVRPVTGEVYLRDYASTKNPKVIPALNKFKQYADRRGAQVTFLYPVAMVSKFDACEKEIALFAADLENNLQIPILGTPADMRLDDSYFFDTTYHLLGEGTNIRTQKIISLLQNR